MGGYDEVYKSGIGRRMIRFCKKWGWIDEIMENGLNDFDVKDDWS